MQGQCGQAAIKHWAQPHICNVNQDQLSALKLHVTYAADTSAVNVNVCMTMVIEGTFSLCCAA